MVAVSLLVSIYNSKKYIAGKLEDIENQTLFQKGDVEVILVLSGTEHLEDIKYANEFKEKYPDKVIIVQEYTRDTMYAAWNKAILVSTGLYLSNSNTDDRQHPEALEILYKTLEETKTDVAYYDFYTVKTPNAKWGDTYDLYLDDPIHYNNGRTDWATKTFNPGELMFRCIIGPQPMWRKSLHYTTGEFRGLDESFQVCADYELWCYFVTIGAKFQNVPQILGMFLMREDQVSRINGQHLEMENLRIHLRHNQSIAEVVQKKHGNPI